MKKRWEGQHVGGSLPDLCSSLARCSLKSLDPLSTKPLFSETCRLYPSPHSPCWYSSCFFVNAMHWWSSLMLSQMCKLVSRSQQIKHVSWGFPSVFLLQMLLSSSHMRLCVLCVCVPECFLNHISDVFILAYVLSTGFAGQFTFVCDSSFAHLAVCVISQSVPLLGLVYTSHSQGFLPFTCFFFFWFGLVNLLNLLM